MRLFRLVTSVGALAAGVLFLSPADAAERAVYIREMAGPEGRFEAAPGSSSATINQGDRVSWVNQDSDTHRVVGQGFDTGDIAEGSEGSHVFNTPGRFDYHCSIHPSMTGTLQVNAASTTAPPATATPTQPPATARPAGTTRAATATTRRTTGTTTGGATTTIAGDFSMLAPTTTQESTTSTTGDVAIREDDDGGGSNAGVIAALAVGLAAILGGGAYALARLRGRPG